MRKIGPTLHYPDVTILDFTDRDNPPPSVRGKVKHRIRRGKVSERTPDQVDTLVVHQTAVTFGRGRYPTRHHRALDVACHALAFNDGVVARAAPLAWYVYHGNGFNARSVGLEIEGSFPGLMDDPTTPAREDLRTHWGDESRMTPVTDLLVDTAFAAIEDLVWRATLWGADLRYIVAHRQSSATRRSDPGEQIWKEVVLPAADAFGLVMRPKWIVGEGRTIPKEWDEDNGHGRY